MAIPPIELTPEQKARLAEEQKAIAIRAEELLRQHEYEQQQIEERIQREEVRKEQLRRVMIDAKLSTLLNEMEVDANRQELLRADDEAIMKLIHQLELAEG